jgi:hypothetical protein
MEKSIPARSRGWPACTALALLLVGPANAERDQVALPRVRSGSGEVTRLLALGSMRSETFRLIVERLERSSVVVYVRFARCTGRVPACVHYLGEGNGNRYVRITIDRLAGPNRRLCCLLAHELQHAIELADAPQLRTRSDVERRLRLIGRRWAEGFETAGAAAVARQVERELAAVRGSGKGSPP